MSQLARKYLRSFVKRLRESGVNVSVSMKNGMARYGSAVVKVTDLPNGKVLAESRQVIG